MVEEYYKGIIGCIVDLVKRELLGLLQKKTLYKRDYLWKDKLLLREGYVHRKIVEKADAQC